MAVLREYDSLHDMQRTAQVSRNGLVREGDNIDLSAIYEYSDSSLIQPHGSHGPEIAAFQSSRANGSVCELRLQRISFGEQEKALGFLETRMSTLIEARGGTLAAIFEVWLGQSIPTIVTFSFWPDGKEYETTDAASMPDPNREMELLRAQSGAPVFEIAETYILESALTE
jgi:hypothetical protein